VDYKVKLKSHIQTRPGSPILLKQTIIIIVQLFMIAKLYMHDKFDFQQNQTVSSVHLQIFIIKQFSRHEAEIYPSLNFCLTNGQPREDISLHSGPAHYYYYIIIILLLCYYYYYIKARLWSSGQRSWLQIQRFRVFLPALPYFPKSSVSGMASIQPLEDSRGAT
jgi:hypothetical protein